MISTELARPRRRFFGTIAAAFAATQWGTAAFAQAAPIKPANRAPKTFGF